MRLLLPILLLIFTPLASAQTCERIVSLAPSISQVLVELGLSKQVVGVTSYDSLRDGATAVGGYIDPAIETIYRLKPTVIFAPEEGKGTVTQLRNLKLKVVTIDHRSVDLIRNSIGVIGDFCGVTTKATALISSLDQETNELKSRATPSKRILIALGATTASNDLSKIYISGNDGYYSSLLPLVGGVNVQQGRTYPLGAITVEGLRGLNPEIIIEIFPAMLPQSLKDSREKVWQEALKKEVRVLVIDEEFALIPGPSYIKLARKISTFLHGEKP